MSDCPKCLNLSAPSPTPPWHRPTQTPQIDYLYGDGTISLTCDTTELDQTAVKQGAEFYTVVLPNGNYKRQYKTIYIKDENQLTSYPFKVTGSFVGWTALILKPGAFNVIIMWTGTAWTICGGNAELAP